MRRDTFDQIMRCLHFSDNMQMQNDRFHKVRPIFTHMNQVMKNSKFQGKFMSVDEIMVPYYGRHGDKQYIRGKPVRFGFKLWAACASDGTLLHVEPYCGSCTNIPDHGFGHGPNVVLEMVNKTGLKEGQHVICDNYFGTVLMLKELARMKIACTTTLREDRLGGAPVLSRPHMNKKARGSMEEVYTDCVSLVKWKDNKVVSVASNKMRAQPLQKVKRWDRKQKKYIYIDIPNSICIYNKYMGGVDLFDQQVAAYRIRIRSKKWWWPLFAWRVNAQVVNAWRFSRRNHPNLILLNFTRNLVIAVLKTYGVAKKRPGPKYPLGSAAESV
ncbi:piggyBac transposable element-derived protein 3-like [Lepeophtheirus salmonis]|uniref:piggyBac transposable element-derived protein 3-like n=1 Tax=Lepeophtheirus salmonis TaxID=72036 RepID=UPI003AF3C1A8